MAIKFNPNGYLNIATDPLDLPEKADQKDIVSGSMTRCKNLDLNYDGIAKTRRGSSLMTSISNSETIKHLQVMDGNRYEFGSSIIYKNESSLGSGYSSDNWDSLVYKAFNATEQNIFALNGIEKKRIDTNGIYEWGIDSPTDAPTLQSNVDYITSLDWEVSYVSSGYQFTVEAYNTTYTWEVAAIEGTPQYNELVNAVATNQFEIFGNESSDKYYVVYTYCRKEGDLLLCESNASPHSDTQLENCIYVSWAAPSDTQVTHVRVYRTLPNFFDYYYAGEFDVNDTWGVLTATDEDLGALIHTDHDRPQPGSLLEGPNYSGICFLAYNNILYYCKPKQPEYWPLLYNVEIGTDQNPIMGMAHMSGYLYVATAYEIYQIQGTGVESFFPLPMAAITGTRSSKVFLPIKGFGLWHLGYDGLYLYTSNTDILISDNAFAPIFNNESKNDIPYINKNYLSNCIMVKFENKVYFAYPGESSIYCDNILTINLESNLMQGITGKFTHYQYPVSFTTIFSDYEGNNLLGVDTAGNIFKLEDGSETTDNNNDISWELESKSFGNLRKFFPRWSRYDVNLLRGSSASGKIMLNGIEKQNHPIVESRNNKKRLIDGCTGDRLSIRLSGIGPVEIHSAEVE
jgi:hypothetical protein